jgi:hypothetical protein
MATKKIEEEVLEDVAEETLEEAPAPRLTSNFGREDLNELRDVVNELWAERG